MNKENVIKTSFFDQKNFIHTEEEKSLCYCRPEGSFWLSFKESTEDLHKMFAYLNDDVLQEGYLSKKSKKEKGPLRHYYRLYKDRLERYSSPVQESPQKVLILRGVKCELINTTDDEDFKESADKFLIIFTINKQFIILYCGDEHEYGEWSIALKQTCILSYFGKYYKNQKVIGRGTFAKVILSKNLLSNQEFAVKTFDKKNLLSESTSNKARIGLINEIHLMMMLDNPNIIKLYEVYEGEYHIYLVMELLNGGELFDRIMNKGHYEEKDAAILISKLISALVYLHSMNIMHRDIKPENLILKDENGFDLKLADFGLAEFVNQKTHLFKRCGTPGYVAPEILEDQPYDTKVDVFSAGVILYILLTGCSPFYGETYNEILVKNKKCEVNYELEELKVKVSEQAVSLLKQMLQKEPGQRITARECLNHPWIKSNCLLTQADTSPVSPYKNKRQSISWAMENLKLEGANRNAVQSNLFQFRQMNNHLSGQRPSNLVINSPMKYNKQSTLEQDDLCSPYLRKHEKAKQLQMRNSQAQPFKIQPLKIEEADS